MSSKKFFSKKRTRIPERKKELYNPKPNSFLIVSEGMKTEPLYFEGLATYINEKYGKSVDIQKPTIKTEGRGRCTVRLVEEAVKIASTMPIPYSQVWVVFDKDDYQDFDEAIALAKSYGYQVAWSNPSFEYWIYLHFNRLDSALHRNDLEKRLDHLFKSKKICADGYKKNNPDIFNITISCGSLKSAIAYAKQKEDSYPPHYSPSQMDPCTTVHHLIEELSPYIKELLQ